MIQKKYSLKNVLFLKLWLEREQARQAFEYMKRLIFFYKIGICLLIYYAIKIFHLNRIRKYHVKPFIRACFNTLCVLKNVLIFNDTLC